MVGSVGTRTNSTAGKISGVRPSGVRSSYDRRGGRGVRQVFINEMIKAPRLIVIDEEGQKQGPMRRDQALRLRLETGLDLVQMAYDKDTKTCTAKLIDYGKYQYEQKKKKKEQKKSQGGDLKQVKISYSIGDHDLQNKHKQVVKFLQGGNSVKVTLTVKGRERSQAQKAKQKISDFVASFAEYGKSQFTQPREERRGYSLMIIPLKS